MPSRRNLFFLVASVRSGTTLLGDMLDHHPEICFPGEFELAVDLLGPNGELPELAAYHDWLRLNRHFLGHRLRIDPGLGYRELVASFLDQMQQGASRRGAEKPVLGVGVHRRFRALAQLFPDARFVHLVRDPRDVAASIVEQGWAGNHYTGARQWRDTEAEWEHAKTGIPDERRLEVGFEALVTDAPATLGRICDFLGVAYSDAMLRYPEDSTYEPVDAGIAQRWKRRASSRATRLAEAGAGEWLARRGYAPSGLAPLRVGALGERAIALHCRASRLRFRLRRYGVGFWLRRRAAMALGLEAWRRRIVLEEHEITNRHLK
jgi:hypothetical protein